MGVWNSSRHTVQEMTPVLRARSLEQEARSCVSKWGSPSSNPASLPVGDTPHSHLHVARLLVVAEGAGELRLQGAGHLFLGGRLSLGLPASHVCVRVDLGGGLLGGAQGK